MNKLVSVIVPVYNVEKYIKKCLLSLLNQDYTNIEIIAVDDGTPDSSGAILDEIAKLDSRVVAIHKENNGVSSARNAGLEVANGDYVMFVDGDDWVDEQYVSYFVNLIENNDTKIGVNINNYSVSTSNSSDSVNVMSSEKVIEMLYLGDLFVAVWNKIYSMELLKKNKITFNQKLWYGEGMLFNIECLQFADKVSVGQKSVYHQTFNPDSAMRKFNLKSNLNGILSLDIQKTKWKKKTKKIEKAWIYHKYCFNRSIIDGIVRSDLQSEYPHELKKCIKNLRKDFWTGFLTEKRIKRKIGLVIYCIFPILMAKRNALRHKKNVKRYTVDS